MKRKPNDSFPIIMPGKRALIAGRTGSGKSTLACWLLNRSPGRWLILNPKHTSAYSDLDNSNVVAGIDMRDIEKSMQKYRFTIINPTSRESSPDNMDDFILELHESWGNIGLCCDELYTVHKNGVAGAGLLGWLTRGRELRQSFLGLTQRPAFLSQFLFSESDYISTMSLSLQRDRKRMIEMTDQPLMGDRIPPRHWTWYDVVADDVKFYGPVPIA